MPYERYLVAAGEAINQGDVQGALRFLQIAIGKVAKIQSGGGIPSDPPGGCQEVTNLYVEDGKLKVEYEE